MKITVHYVFSFFFLAILSGLVVTLNPVKAQIYEPEGLNMPGAWNTWTNPPANNLALASSTQVPGGRVVKITTGTLRWQTIFSVAAAGGDLTAGTYEWLFTSGPASNYYQNKWANVTMAMNTLQNYVKEGASNNSVSLVNNKWYTVNWEDKGYMDTRGIFMETSAQPVTITAVSVPSSVAVNTPVTINVTLSQAKCAEEIIYLRYTSDSWTTSAAVPVSMSGTAGTAQIPGFPAATVVSYYVFSSTVPSLSADYDLCTIKLNNNSATNYSYTVAPPPPVISWANLQFPPSGSIQTGQSYVVYGQAYIAGVTGQATPAAGLQAWVGYHTANTDPATWSNWVPATYFGAVSNNDEFTANIGSVITSAGTYYYATRFKLNSDPYVYGGFSSSGGGFWDGTTNTSGVLTVSDPVPNPDFDWVNLQYPPNGAIEPGQLFNVYAQSYIAGVTGQATPAPGEQAWIGFSQYNTNPSTWTDWVPASFNGPTGNNDEFVADLGAQLTGEGTYYYASRFRKNSGSYFYGGYSSGGGGFWDGVNNVSGTVTVQSAPPNPGIDWANLQYPGSGQMAVGGTFDVYAQAYIAGVTGQPSPAAGLVAWIGYNAANTDPSTWTTWVPASYNTAAGNNDEFQANIGPEFPQPGTWYYASRFSMNGGPYVFGGFSETGGGFWDGSSNVSGILTVTPPPVTYPVQFTIIDGTQLHDNIKFKGSMTNWEPVAMTPNDHVWTLSLNLAPGDYEWGAIQDDGTQYGLWLIQGPNLAMNVDSDGNVTGIVSYTTYVTDVSRLKAQTRIYPNPFRDWLNIELSEPGEMVLMDMAGRELMSWKLEQGLTSLNLASQNRGVYLLKIGHGREESYRTIIKL